MLQRVETDATEIPGGVVAEPVGDESVGGLMKVMAITSGSTQTDTV